MPNSQVDVTAGAPNLESYTDNGDGTVTDNVTGLIWQQVLPSSQYTWAQAVAFCPTLNLAGRNDWRLPSNNELRSLVDTGQANPSISITYFPSTPASRFWTSTPSAPFSDSAWVVDFASGESYYPGVSISYNVRCVR
jgi:hypothetical protein